MIRVARVLAVIAALAVLVAALAPLLKRVENATIDVRFDARGTQPTHGLAVVGIDERTFQRLDQRWPFPRTLHAQLIDRLKEAGVRQIVYDVQFTEPSENEDEDLALYDSVANAKNVILATGEIDEQGRTRVLGGDEQLKEAGNAEAAASTFPTDPGGTIRRYNLQDTGLDTIPALVATRNGRRPANGALIDFRGPAGTIPTYSFADVYEGRVSTQLKDKIVVVGATAPSLQDIHPTSAPGSRQMPGAEIEASAIHTALNGNPLKQTGATFLIALLLGSVAPLAVRLLGPVKGSAATIVVAALYAITAQLAFNRGTVLPVAVPLVTLAASLAISLIVRAATAMTARARTARYNEELEAAVLERTKELAETQLEVVVRLAHAAELHDDDTGEHIDRMSRLCAEVALELGLPPARADMIRHAAVLHDVGKIGVPDEILRKPGRLTSSEMATMRRHVAAGALLLKGSDSPLLQVAEVIASTHHERWDGGGYPKGLAGEEIPLEGRIAAVCDVFDALTHQRPYKEAWGPERACDEIASLRGTHFDPDVADALLKVIARRLGSGPVAHAV
jgi:CHASE2 domain-containing sensor protein